MTLNRVSCPECGAGLKSPSGFNPGQTVCCPKCETYFAVEEPADEPKKALAAGAGTGKKPTKAAVVADDEYEQPKKKKKKAASDDDPESEYKNSTTRYAILGVLVCVMVGLGVMLYLKKRDEAKQNETAGNGNAPADAPLPPVVGPPPIPTGSARPVGVGSTPVVPKPKSNSGTSGGFAIPLLDGGPTLTPAETTAKLKQLQAKLVGKWKAELTGASVGAASAKKAELVYNADGTFTDTLSVGGTPTTISGRWTADRLVAGNKGILINRTVGGTQTKVKAEFEDDELLHDTQERGTIGTFRK
jgi:hypothetical protein